MLLTHLKNLHEKSVNFPNDSNIVPRRIEESTQLGLQSQDNIEPSHNLSPNDTIIDSDSVVQEASANPIVNVSKSDCQVREKDDLHSTSLSGKNLPPLKKG